MNVVCLRPSIVVQNADIGTLKSQTEQIHVCTRLQCRMHRDCVSQPKEGYTRKRVRTNGWRSATAGAYAKSFRPPTGCPLILPATTSTLASGASQFFASCSTIPGSTNLRRLLSLISGKWRPPHGRSRCCVQSHSLSAYRQLLPGRKWTSSKPAYLALVTNRKTRQQAVRGSYFRFINDPAHSRGSRRSGGLDVVCLIPYCCLSYCLHSDCHYIFSPSLCLSTIVYCLSI